MKRLVDILLVMVACWIVAGILLFNTMNKVGYYATFENGATRQVDSIIAVPILSVEQISRMWPEYHIETTVDIEGKEITLRSKPFLFCDDPELEGSYAGRDVYCPEK